MNQKLFSNFTEVTSKEWKEKILKELKGKDFSELIFKSDEIEIDPFYQQNNTETLRDCDVFCNAKKNLYSDILAYQPINKNSPSLTDEISKTGGGAWELIFDNFYDNNGIVIDKDLSSLLGNVAIENNVFYLRGGLQSIAVWELFSQFCQKSSVPIPYGSMDNDPIIELMLRGELAEKDDFLRCKEVISATPSQFMGITIQGQHFQNLGSSIVQELAFTFATAIEYCDKLSDLGIVYDEIISNMRFSLAVSNNYFLEIAKLRAAKLLWANITSQFNLSSSFPIQIHAETCLWNKSSSDVHTNIIRGTVETMAAIVSGCQSVTIHPFDFESGSSMGTRVTRNIYHILQEEAFLEKCINPCSGSYFIESLTNRFANEAWSLIQKIEKKGGFLSALSDNYISKEIERKRIEKENDILQKKKILVGINKYKIGEKKLRPSKKIRYPSCQKKEITSIKEIRKILSEFTYQEAIASLYLQREIKIERLSRYVPETLLESQGSNHE